MNLELANFVKVASAVWAVIGLIELIVWAIRNAYTNKAAEIILIVFTVVLLLGVVGVIVWAWCTW